MRKGGKPYLEGRFAPLSFRAKRRYTKGMEKHQVKSHWYYLFWGVMAVAVCSGQYYVGSGHRELAAQQKQFAQAIYDQQMGWGACEQKLEMQANRQVNKTGEFE